MGVGSVKQGKEKFKKMLQETHKIKSYSLCSVALEITGGRL